MSLFPVAWRLIILGSRSLSENVLDVDHNIIEPWDAVGTHYNIQARRGGFGSGRYPVWNSDPVKDKKKKIHTVEPVLSGTVLSGTFQTAKIASLYVL